MSVISVADLWLTTPIAPWRDLGFVLSSDREFTSGDIHFGDIHGSTESIIDVAGLGFRFMPPIEVGADLTGAVAGWTLVSNDDSSTLSNGSVDGIATKVIFDPLVRTEVQHGLRILAIDHVVISTGSLDRTCAAVSDQLGAPLKRIREAGRGVRQGFHRVGSLILEIVERPDLTPETPASLWGVVFVVEDLDAALTWLGPDVVGAPRDAVQPGRRIASLKKEVGLGLPVALMTPHKS